MANDPLKAIDGRFITAQVATDIPTIRVQGYVGESFTGAQLADAVEYLCGEAGECRILLDTQGGYVHDAWHFYDYVRANGLKVHIVGFGRVASAGTVIMAAAGRKRSMLSPNAMYLIHNVSGSDDMDVMEVENEKLRAMYVELTGMSRKRVKEMMDADKPITAQQAAEMGFVGGVLELQKLAASSGLKIQDMTEDVDVKTAVVEDHTELDENGNPTIIEPTPEVVDETPEPEQVEVDIPVNWRDAIRGYVKSSVSAELKDQLAAAVDARKEAEAKVGELEAEVERLSEGITAAGEELTASATRAAELEAEVETLKATIERLEKQPIEPKGEMKADVTVQEPGATPEANPSRPESKTEKQMAKTIERQKARMAGRK